jgi:bacterioferritin-associated ferredoxin
MSSTTDNMYVCLCNAVKASEIENAIANGVITLDALQDTLDVANNCGACQNDVQEILDACTT